MDQPTLQNDKEICVKKDLDILCLHKKMYSKIYCNDKNEDKCRIIKAEGNFADRLLFYTKWVQPLGCLMTSYPLTRSLYANGFYYIVVARGEGEKRPLQFLTIRATHSAVDVIKLFSE